MCILSCWRAWCLSDAFVMVLNAAVRQSNMRNVYQLREAVGYGSFSAKWPQVSQQLWDAQLPTFILFEGGKEVARMPRKKGAGWRKPKHSYVRPHLSVARMFGAVSCQAPPGLVFATITFYEIIGCFSARSFWCLTVQTLPSTGYEVIATESGQQLLGFVGAMCECTAQGPMQVCTKLARTKPIHRHFQCAGKHCARFRPEQARRQGGRCKVLTTPAPRV